ncbi:hypothetical protein ES703_112331 [subsurface metagenome]
MRFCKTFEFLQAKVFQSKDGPNQPSRAIGDHDRVGFGHRLKSRGEIRPFAQDLRVVDSPRSGKIADNHYAGGNAYAYLERLPTLHKSYSVDQSQASSHGLLRIVLVRVGITEIDKDTITHSTSDKAAEPCHDFSNALLVCSDHFMEIFDIEMYR